MPSLIGSSLAMIIFLGCAFALLILLNNSSSRPGGPPEPVPAQAQAEPVARQFLTEREEAMLAAIAGGAESYATFRDVFTHDSGALNPLGCVIGVGMTWAFFTHALNGIRHLVMDAGAAFELKRNKMFSMVVIVGGVVLTAAFWLYLGMK